MEDWGLLKIATAVPKLVVADPQKNSTEIMHLCEEAHQADVNVLCFPELALTGYTCADLFGQSSLQEASDAALLRLAEASVNWPGMLLLLGAPLVYKSRLYNCALAIRNGFILAAVPKSFLPRHHEFYETRWFSAAPAQRSELSHSVSTLTLGDQDFPFGKTLIHCRLGAPGASQTFAIGIEICEDLWMPAPPSTQLALAGAQLIFNLSASNELVAKAQYRQQLISQQSARLNCAYIYAAAGPDESTTDLVFGGHCLLAENGKILAERPALHEAPALTTAVVDLQLLNAERQRNVGFSQDAPPLYPQIILQESFRPDMTKLLQERSVNPLPFVPQNPLQRDTQTDQVLRIQTYGLAKRLEHTGIKHAVLGISGGLDSTLALLVVVRAYQLLNWPLSDIHALTLPGYGTTDRTYNNAVKLMQLFGLTYKEISIVPAVEQHFKDIGHDPAIHDTSYENSQARERTQILMDYANKVGGLVVGTGDLSELALGWCTYNGDHMSMYGVNASVPKTLVRHLVAYQASLFEVSEDSVMQNTAAVLRDILATPISPELLPPDKDGKIAQLTEDSTGPYILHDFFLNALLRHGYGPEKIFALAKLAFGAEAQRPIAESLSDPSLAVPIFDDTTILKWLDTFYRRFFSQQFKRSCMPDGPQVGAVALSPRGSWRMPSDASATVWRDAITKLREG